MASPTLSKKRFKYFDACGTDGTDDKKIMAVYEVIDTDGYNQEVRIKKSVTAITVDTELQSKLNAITIKPDHYS